MTIYVLSVHILRDEFSDDANDEFSDDANDEFSDDLRSQCTYPAYSCVTNSVTMPMIFIIGIGDVNDKMMGLGEKGGRGSGVVRADRRL